MPDLFTLSGKLPTGLTIVEASAGTGKTYTLASLVVRYVCETDLTIDQILVVTFTRAAAAELRDRIRTRLLEALILLDETTTSSQPSPTQPATETDVLLPLLKSLPYETARSRISRALVDFDTATITTIHGFAQQALSAMGTSIATSTTDNFVGSDIDLIEQACTDTMICEVLGNREIAQFMPTLSRLVEITTIVLNNHGIDLLPAFEDSSASIEAQLTHRLITNALRMISERRIRQGISTYGDLLTNLASVLATHREAAVHLRRRYAVALIDEFQDTDELQWNIFSELFSQSTALVLVADPKQAIYSFRGADIHSYLRAKNASSATHSSLGTNYRSDEAVVTTVNALFDGVTFGDRQIDFLIASPSPEGMGRRLRDQRGIALPALHIRTVLGPHIERKDESSFTASASAVGEYVATDLAHHIRDLLATAVLPQRGSLPPRPVRPSDIAILVRSHADGAKQYRALRRLGIPVVSSRTGFVLDSVAFDHWRYLLRSIEQPTNPQRARTAAKSWFFGWTDDQLDACQEQDFADLHNQLQDWSDTLRCKGVSSFCTRAFEQSNVRMRALATLDGNRNLTDLEHIAEILRSLVPESYASAAVLCSRLENLALEAPTDHLVDVVERRVESADEAVQIMTIYAAKGLQFPIVCIPELYRPARVQDMPFQNPATGRRTFDLAKNAKRTTSIDSKELMSADSLGEQLRLLYVALTRAQHQTILWWSRSYRQGTNALSHLLFARNHGVMDSDMLSKTNISIPSDDDVVNGIREIFSTLDDAFSLTMVDHPDHMVYMTPTSKAVAAPYDPSSRLDVAPFDRKLDRSYGRWSFTAITSDTYHEHIAQVDESLGDAGANDEIIATSSLTVDNALEPLASDLPLGHIPGGAAFGTLVHEVLEHTDFSSPDLRNEIMAVVQKALEASLWPVNADDLVDGLVATITSPLGPLFNGGTLRDIKPIDRLDELSFEIHLGTSGARPSVSDIGQLVRSFLNEHDPLLSWAKRLAANEIPINLRGHLTGSIDLVSRVISPESSEPRYIIADYKTNRLTSFGHASLARNYAPDQLPHAMVEHHYPLQALLYGVALHRYLRWRQPNYDPDLHLGGAAYLFIRGMAGAMTAVSNGAPNGVFTWKFPAGLIANLSDLFAHGRID